MLSSHSVNAAPQSNPLNAGVPQRTNPQGDQQQAPAPGTKEGSVPVVNPLTAYQQNQPNQPTNPLEQYAVKPDTSPNPQQPANPPANQQQQPTQQPTSNMPTAEDFSKLAAQISSSLTPPNQELITQALSGGEDAGQALMQLLSAQQSELMSKTMHATFLANNKMAERNNEGTTTKIKADLENQSFTDTATTAAKAKSPELGEGIKATLLNTAIAELRKQYPTAPANLIGEEAAKQLITTPTDNEQQGNPTTNMNWIEQLGG